MIKALIVDDEQHNRDTLSSLLTKYCPKVTISAEVESVAKAREVIHKEKIDVIFLDISMPVENGFNLLPDIKDKDILVVFVTGYEQFAIKAIRANAFDYILKPIDTEDLISAYKRLCDFHLTSNRIKILEDKYYRQSITNLYENFEKQTKPSKITLTNTTGYNIVDFKDILYLEADGNYTLFKITQEKKILVSRSLKEYETLLDEDLFVRVHKSYLVNLSHIDDCVKKEDSYIAKMRNGDKILISRRKSGYFLNRLKQYIDGVKA